MELFLLSKLYHILSLSSVLNRSYPMPTTHQSDVYYASILSYINDHYAENITISDISKHVHISPTYIRKICHEKAGSSPQKLIAQKRLNMAKVLLANDNSSIEEIASLVGFSNVYAFSNFFKKQNGQPPSVYRKNMEKVIQKTAEPSKSEEKQ